MRLAAKRKTTTMRMKTRDERFSQLSTPSNIALVSTSRLSSACRASVSNESLNSQGIYEEHLHNLSTRT